ncbi:M14 family zinc carboxypeptidase [Mucilaginibacter lacusdianchii]|uniref:M14 family zinc carboxypeptidase n=1 Tax=Mucilaginibacter lacusdianchii TaxID=2684211 RepID=UPI00131C1577|nr:M14 family zinc carboxypeptidase [Mucilaginibacter sp. JXJ CY 39]
MAYYPQLVKQYPKQLRLFNYGSTDIGKPLTLAVLSKDGVFDPALLKKQNKRVILINNGIHPGEPEGIDASMMLVRDLLSKNQLPKDVVICFIAVYNIDGSLNRGVSRISQNGPRGYGFRGNYRNLDLNRDFIKGDSRNALTFMQILNTWQPEVFLDNHTSDGADYQYVMTLIETQKDKQHPLLADYTSKTLSPELYKRMAASGYEMIPYVESEKATPDSGIVAFLETPRFSTGYTVQHNIISYVTETHMLKPYDKRVWSTYYFMQHLIDICQRDAPKIGNLKRQTDAQVQQQNTFALNWALDEEKYDMIPFKGYEAGYKPSEISGLNRLYYDRNKPYTKNIKYYNTYKATAFADKPLAYVIPQAWGKVIDLFKLNKVAMHRLKHDTTLSLQMYYITDYKTSPRPYEGHYLHSGVKLNPVDTKVKFYEGDYVVYTNQPINRYIVETLEPQGVDSFFAWNFFDSYLGQKEHYSDYVFEDIAAAYLKQHPELQKQLEAEKTKNPQLAKSASAQLEYVYRNSEYFEKTYLRYPVGRLLTDVKLDFQ